MSKPLRLLSIMAFLSIGLVGVRAEEAKEAEKKPDTKDEAKRFVTHHELTTIDGETIQYTATVGETFLKDEKGKNKASIFTISYTRDEVEDPTTRPLAFFFNGGPGSSSVWLHLGLLGPKRVDVPSDATDVGAPPYVLQDNPVSLLAVTDLVAVDPVGTGFSHAVGDGKDEDYWGVDEDAASVAEFIRNYLTENQRWNSPKYLIGESYGTIRATMLVRDLQNGLNSVALNGVVLVSPALDTGLILGGGADLPYVTYLPAYAATAWYHKALPGPRPTELEPFLKQVEDFASTDYLLALFQGDKLDDATKGRILDKLHEYSGLSRTYLENAKLRVNSARFMRELLRDRGLVVGGLDSRYTGKEPDDVGEYPSDDPSGYGVDAAFVAAMNDYLTRDLKVKMDREYTIVNMEANGKWKRPGRSSIFQGFLYVMPYLADGMAANKDLRVFVASGYYDLTTTFSASEYMFSHGGLDTKRVTMRNYEAGHMMYVHRPSFERLAGDLHEFIAVAPG